MRNSIISFTTLRPFVRYVQHLMIGPDTYATNDKVYPYDCRLFYIESGHGQLQINNEYFRLEPHQITMWLAGVGYRIDSDPTDPLVLYGVNFDCTQGMNSITTPIPPCALELFSDNNIWEKVEFSDYPRLNKLVLINQMQSFEIPLQEMLYEYKTQKTLWRERANSILSELLIQLCRLTLISHTEKNNQEVEFDVVLDYIHTHYAKNIDNAFLGDFFGYHPNSLSRIFRIYTGKSLHQYIIQYRISRSIDYLLSTDYTVSDICYKVGFHDVCNFSKIFKKKTGISPGAFRRSAITEQG